MRLVDLEPEWLRYNDARSFTRIESRDAADGILFLCPKCYAANGGPVGTHVVICWFEGRVPDDASPGPGRWTPQGDRFDTLTFVPGARNAATSVLLTGGCGWHGHIVNGEATLS